MTFAAPLFLLAAAAAAIPVLLHLIGRRRAKELPFPTLRYLKQSAEKTRRRKRIHDAALMLLRAAALLLAAAGLARPSVTRLGRLWGAAHTAAVVVLDNSASMGIFDRDRLRLDTAEAAAMQVFDQLAPGDQVALLAACGPASAETAKLERTQDSARQSLAQCRPSYGRADLTARLEDARKLLAKSDAPNKQIYILTDMQRVSWETSDGGRTGSVGQIAKGPSESGSSLGRQVGNLPHGESPEVAVVVVDCNRQPKPDAAVETIEVDAPAPVSGAPVKIAATLLNVSTVSQVRLIELVIDGAKAAGSPELALPPGGRVRHEFQFVFDRPGLHRGEVRLVGEDGSKYDDRRLFTIEIDPAVPVAVVKTRQHEIAYLDDAFYLERAFGGSLPLHDAAASRGDEGGPSGAICAATLPADELTGEPLDKYRVLFCVNLPALKAEAADRLRAYVEGGGSLVWIAGDEVEPEAYNRMNEAAEGRLLPAPLMRLPARAKGRDAWHVAWLDEKHPALARLTDPPSLYQSVLVYQRVGMAADTVHAQVLAKLDDGEPVLIERQIGRGRAVMLGTGVQVGWSNLPLRQIFLPLVTQLTLDLAGVRPCGNDLLAGQPISLDLAGHAEPVEVEVTRPSGETLRLRSEPEPGRPGQVFRYADTHEIGVYVLRLMGAAPPARKAYAVNSDPAEADPRKIEPQELEKRLGGAPLLMAADPDDLSGTFALLREGRGLEEPLLIGVLIFLVFETLVSNRVVPCGR